MKKFEKFLFFYSILSITLLLITFGIFEPKPINIISVIVLAPLLFYFWIRFTNPEKISAERWSLRLLIVIVLMVALGVYTTFLSKQFTDTEPVLQSQLAEQLKINEELKAKIASLTIEQSQNPISKLKESTVSGESATDLITATDSAISKSQITGKPGVTTINVYENPISASKKIGTLDTKQKYFYLEKQFNWYKIQYSVSITGWVSTTQVQEVQL